MVLTIQLTVLNHSHALLVEAVKHQHQRHVNKSKLYMAVETYTKWICFSNRL